MKAVVFREHGEVDKLEYTDIERPEPGPDEVRVKIAACALNHLDIWVRLGGRPVTIPMPHIGGSDVSGFVDKVGDGVEGIEAGARCIVAPGLSDGADDYCMTGRESGSPSFKILGFQTQGGYAEYICVPARNIIPVSDVLTMQEWASIPLVFLTSYHMLFHHLKLQVGETVLIQAAGSGLGISAIQLAKNAGARVITTAGSDEKLQTAKQLGADEVINYKTQDFVAETLNLTNEEGVDAVFEHIGGDTFVRSLDTLKRYGRLAVCGVTEGPEATINISKIYAKQLSIYGSLMGSIVELKQVIQMAERGEIKPVVDQVFPLEDAKEAQQRMLDRKNFGKIVLKVSDQV